MSIVLAFAFLAGILTILAPCTLPVVPLVLGGAAAGDRRRIAGLFVGFGASFVVVTVLAAALLASLGLTTSILRLGAVLVLGLAGLSLALPRLGDWLAARVPVPQLGLAAAGGGFGGGLVLGAGIGLVWAPCVGPIMAAVIAAAVVSGPTVGTVAVASAYVAGAIVPLAAIARWGRRITATAGG